MKEKLTTDRYQTLLGCVRELSYAVQAEDFHGAAARAVAPLLGHGWIGSEVYDFDPFTHVAGTIWNEITPQMYDAFIAHAPEHAFFPALKTMTRHGVITMRCFGKGQLFTEMGIYHDFSNIWTSPIKFHWDITWKTPGSQC